MRNDRPSFTATFVAFIRAAGARGVSSVRGYADPVSEKLLPAGLRPLVRTLGWVAGQKWARRALWWSSLGLIDMVPLRTAAIDRALCDALRATPDLQLVILGAGLDARAGRMPELAGTVVFEVDHPASQAGKRAGAAGISPTARGLHFVEVDFEHGAALEPALAAAGHRAEIPTFWIWEGVVMYLPPPAMRATVAELASRSAPGSQLCATYMVTSWGRRAVELVVSAVGEPLLGLTTPADMGAALASGGFRVIDDASLADHARELAAAPLFDNLVASERVVLARKAP